MYENKILLQADISHKILRSDTILSNMYAIMEYNRSNFKAIIAKSIIGQIVLTRFVNLPFKYIYNYKFHLNNFYFFRYNNKTYHIDDIDWGSNPLTKFKKRGDEISFAEYYKSTYNITITDLKQPLLVSNPSKRNIRSGRTESFKLIPEFCNLTGLTDEARSDFSIMKDIAMYTRVPPAQRQTNLLQFMSAIKSLIFFLELLL